jgi:hypothetical protein
MRAPICGTGHLRNQLGGQVSITSEENTRIPNGTTTGPGRGMQKQAERFGTRMLIDRGGRRVSVAGRRFT